LLVPWEWVKPKRRSSAQTLFRESETETSMGSERGWLKCCPKRRWSKGANLSSKKPKTPKKRKKKRKKKTGYNLVTG